MESIAKILKTKRGAWDFGRLALLHQVRSRWPELVGKKLAAQSFVYTLKDQKLYIHVGSSVWLAEFEYLKAPLQEKLQREFEKKIETVICRIGKIPSAESLAAPQEPVNRKKTLQAPTVVEEKVLSAVATEINKLPENLRESFQQIYHKRFGHKRFGQ